MGDVVEYIKNSKQNSTTAPRAATPRSCLGFSPFAQLRLPPSPLPLQPAAVLILTWWYMDQRQLGSPPLPPQGSSG
jgi:hypothetical protein